MDVDVEMNEDEDENMDVDVEMNEDEDENMDVDEEEEENSGNRAKKQKLKSWNFIKIHSHVHAADDIRAKGVTRNYSTKPNEKSHSRLKAAYRRTNFKSIEKQVS